MKLLIAIGVTFFVRKPVFVTFVFQVAIILELVLNLNENPYTKT